MGDDVQPIGEALLTAAADLTGVMSTDDDVVDRTLRTAASAVATVVPGAGHVGAAVTVRGTFAARATGDAVAEELDAVQASGRSGPGPEAAARGTCVEVPDLVADPRWPRLAEAAARHGVTSALSLVLRGHDGVLGVLTLYTPAPLDPDARVLAEALTAQAAVALFGAQRIAGLARAVSSRDVIGQAKGILIQRDGVDDESAFAMLVQASQATNMKLVDVAQWLVSQAKGTATTDAPA
ncbi:GAF and ANTAR domain-containing protein [Actinomycetospora endophytica]|uniref:GAF and ANTAR domain-containing protein n=1 Tax=Actinomycetospora endophytica TaxID=2291215 RepID=A0ABS8P8W1_9PSEU|nr:GAF and ANTAR domain-containing protein [Actinomycetospora endophytica]MCD2194539.1 GAF and ANTAR domain-containing protein [Actinomycetospora endophytica]